MALTASLLAVQQAWSDLDQNMKALPDLETNANAADAAVLTCKAEITSGAAALDVAMKQLVADASAVEATAGS